MEQDGFSFFLTVDTSVQVKPAGKDRFRVVGPPRALAILNRIAKTKDSHGQLAPITSISILDPAARVKAGIPESASHYCFAYPLDCLRSDFDGLLKSLVSSADHTQSDEAVLMFFLLGGFCYFRIEGVHVPPALVAINALTLEPAGQAVVGELMFEGPFSASDEASRIVAKAGRMASMTIGNLVEVGISSFAWINPGEAPGGVSLGRPLPHGAFLYKRTTADGKDHAFYYVIRRDNENLAPTSEERLARLAFERNVPDGGTIQAAFTQIISAFAAAKEEARELEEDLSHWREGAAGQWVRSFGVLLPAYYLVGWIFYGLVEGWSALDVAYYLTTTVTTVGYGDFCPSTALGRWFTALYAPLGTITVMTALLPPVEWTLLQLDEMTAWPVAKAEDWLTRVLTTRWGLVRHTFRDGVLRQIRDGRDGEMHAKSKADAARVDRRHALYGTHAPHVVELTVLGGSTVKVSGEWAMVHALLGPLLLGGIGVLLSLWVHQYLLSDAVYWTIITMTTVGYGDLLPETAIQKLYTMVFMPLAATTLAATVERFEKLRTAHRIHSTNFQLVADTMLRDEAVVQQTMHPSLSESGFILRVLVEENLVEEQTLKVLKGRYAAMLGRGTGLLKRGDGRTDEEGLPKTIDAELIFHMMVQQKRVVDRNLLNAQQRQAALDTQVSILSSQQRRSMAQIRGSESGMGRGQSRGALLSRDSDVTTAVDMSSSDGGFCEWYERFWIPSLQASGVEMTLADQVQLATRVSQIMGDAPAASGSFGGGSSFGSWGKKGGGAGGGANPIAESSAGTMQAPRQRCSFCDSYPCADGCPKAVPAQAQAPALWPAAKLPAKHSPRRSDGYMMLDAVEMPPLAPEPQAPAMASSPSTALASRAENTNAPSAAPAAAKSVPSYRGPSVPPLGAATSGGVPRLVPALLTTSAPLPGAQALDDVDAADPSLFDA